MLHLVLLRLDYLLLFFLTLISLHVLMFIHVATHFLEGLLYDTGTGAG